MTQAQFCGTGAKDGRGLEAAVLSDWTKTWFSSGVSTSGFDCFLSLPFVYSISMYCISYIYIIIYIYIQPVSDIHRRESLKLQQPNASSSSPGLSANYQTTLLLTRVLQEFYKSPYNPQNLRILYTFLVNGDIKGKSRIFATLALEKNRAECCCPFACLETDMLCHRLPKICTVQARIKLKGAWGACIIRESDPHFPQKSFSLPLGGH